MRLEGSFTARESPEMVYRFLTDPERLVQSLPDVQSSEIHSADDFSLAARVGVGPMRGVMEVRFHIVQKEPNKQAVFKGQGKGLGSSVDLETGFNLHNADNGGTLVSWYGDAKIGGRLASVAGGMLEPLAKKNIATFVAAVQRGLEAGR